MVENIEALVARSSGEEMLSWLAALDEKARRAHCEPVKARFRQWYRGGMGVRSGNGEPELRDPDALKVAMLATATAAELKPYGFQTFPRSLPLVEVMRGLAPSWLDSWVEHLVDESPFIADRLAPLWRNGLCRRPSGDARILAYYSEHRDPELTGHPEFLEVDVWRFFEVEGGGDLSLATHDKYCKSETWSNRLLKLAHAGQLDRRRLLDASLDALERDFGQFRAGWYSRFHSALEPTLDEQAARADRYLHLLGSAVPPTVTLALKALKALDKAGRLPVDELVKAVPPALLSRQKSAVIDALQLLASAAKRAPERASEVAAAGLTALISDSADVQEKALDLADRLGASEAPTIRALLEEHRDFVAPSVRPRLSTMLGEAKVTPGPRPQAVFEPAAIVGFSSITPCASLEEALALYLVVLEDPRDPLAVERAMDGLSRFGATASSELSPLAKRAAQLFSKTGYQKVKLALAAIGRAWCEARPPSELVKESRHLYSGYFEESLAATFLERCDEVVARIRDGQALPLLSLPTDSSGQVAPADLVDRLADYRAAGVAPGIVDLVLALTRLGREGRIGQLERVDRTDEPGQAVAFALGHGAAPLGEGPIWAAAWRARADEDGQVPTGWPSKNPEPDAGIVPQYVLILEQRGDSGYPWCHAGVEIRPALKRPDPRIPASLLHHRRKTSWQISGLSCGGCPADIGWASLARPGDPEAFLANAISAMDTNEKLADHPCIAYLDAFDRLSREPGPMGYAVLAYYLASEDKAVCAHTVDKLAMLIERRLIIAERFAAAVLPFLLVGTFPSMRWTRHFGTLAAGSPDHGRFVRDLLAGLMRFGPGQAPRDIGGMIELLFQLQLECGLPLEDPAAIRCLTSLDSGGKAAKFSAKLLSLQSR